VNLPLKSSGGDAFGGSLQIFKYYFNFFSLIGFPHLFTYLGKLIFSRICPPVSALII
jgi:hypothetical protein